MKRKNIVLVMLTIICIVLFYQIECNHILHQDPVYDFKESSTIGEYETLQCPWNQEIRQEFTADSYLLDGIYYILIGFESEQNGEMQIEVTDQNNSVIANQIIQFQNIKSGEWQNIELKARVRKGDRYTLVFQNLSKEITPYILTGSAEEVSKYNECLYQNEQKMEGRLYVGYGFAPEVSFLERVVIGLFLFCILIYAYVIAFIGTTNTVEKETCNHIWTRKIKNKYGHALIGAILGCILFLIIYGTKVLNPTYTDWLLAGGDFSQHYLGWKFFRNDCWSFPVGLMQSIIYPVRVSVIFSDSIPIFAILFKLIDTIIGLPKEFQYFGIWGIVCLMLQGTIAAKILEKYLSRTIDIIAGTLFFLISPILIHRMYNQTSLAGQWIILLSIYMVCYQRELQNGKKGYILCGVIGVLCASIHIYYLPMCGAILLVYAILHAKESKKIVKGILDIALFVFSAIVFIWLLGGFSGGASAGGTGLYKFGMNLNSFFNPYDDYSSIFSTLPRYERTEEGFAYLGFGMIILFSFTCVIDLMKGNLISCKRVLLCSVSLIMLFASLSPNIVLNQQVLITMHLPDSIASLWSVFRATGRLIWPVYYLIMFYAILEDRKYMSTTWKSFILIICVVIQCIDLHTVIGQKHEEFTTKQTYSSFMESPEWQELLNKGNYKHIIFVTDIVSQDLKTLYGVAEYASDHDMTISNFYLARNFQSKITSNLQKSLENPQEDELFVIYQDDDEKLRNINMKTKQIGDFIVGSTNEDFY